MTRAEQKIGSIKKHQFAGAMSFMNWEGKKQVQDNIRKDQEDIFSSWNGDHEDNFVMFASEDSPDKPRESAESSASVAANDTVVQEANRTLGFADVVCIEDCEMYSWEFDDLHKLCMLRPSLGLVMERCLSADLSKKMAESYASEPQLRYKQVLNGTLLDGEVS